MAILESRAITEFFGAVPSGTPQKGAPESPQKSCSPFKRSPFKLPIDLQNQPSTSKIQPQREFETFEDPERPPATFEDPKRPPATFGDPKRSPATFGDKLGKTANVAEEAKGSFFKRKLLEFQTREKQKKVEEENRLKEEKSHEEKTTKPKAQNSSSKAPEKFPTKRSRTPELL